MIAPIECDNKHTDKLKSYKSVFRFEQSGERMPDEHVLTPVAQCHYLFFNELFGVSQELHSLHKSIILAVTLSVWIFWFVSFSCASKTISHSVCCRNPDVRYRICKCLFTPNILILFSSLFLCLSLYHLTDFI